jgi:uncharacterized membrane-anchored protein
MPRFQIALMSVIIAALLGVAAPPVPVQAQAAPAASGEQARQDEQEAAWQAGIAAGTRGPADIPLIDQAVLKLPAGYFFIPKAEGARILRAEGNIVSESAFVGLIGGTNPGDEWLVATRHIKDGYIKDDEARNWDADELLRNLKEGNEEANRDRVTRGFPEVEVLGWVEKPTYDATTHRLVWSMLSKQKGEPDSAVKGINYNTFALGRDGYFSLNLLTRADRISADKVAAHHLLASLSYNPGKRYEDFDAATDHIAEYGIAALVGGVVAKKLGLFALAGVFIAKFAKVIGLAVLALGGGIWNFFRRRPAKSGVPDVE